MPNRKDEIMAKLASLPAESTERAALETELQEIEATDQALSAINLRFQEQEEKVQSLKLPYDFNELYGDSTANDSIIEIVQIFLREANAENNDDLQKLIETHRTEIQASSDRELQLKRQNDEMQLKFTSDQQEILRISQELQQTKLERDDAFAKRDAAVADKEGVELLITEKQAQIDTLRAEIAVGAKSAINVTNISPSDKLAALVEQSKSAKIKSSVELALDRLEPVRGKIEVAVAAPKLPEEATFPTQSSDPANIGLDNSQAGEVPAHDREVTFQLPSANAPEVPSLGTTMATGQPETETYSGITKTELEDRLVKFAAEHGLVKQAVA